MHDNAGLQRQVEENRRQAVATFPGAASAPALIQRLGLTFGELQELELAESEAIILGLLRGQTGMLCGVTNKGKTTLARNLAISLACGREFLPFTERRDPV